MEIGETAINTAVHAVEKVISKQLSCKLLMNGTAWGKQSLQSINITNHGTDGLRVPPHVMHRVEHNITSVVFLPKMRNQNQIMRIIQKKQN